MNIQNDLSYYIDATNEFMGGGGLSGGSTNSNIIIGSGSNATLDKYLYTSNNNLYLANPNSNSGIFFRVYNSPNATLGNYNYSVKIDKDGKIYVYHLYDVLNPTMGAGWYDLEKEMANAIFNTIQTNIQFLAIEGQLVALETQVIANYTTFNNFKNITNSSLLRTSDALEIIGNSLQNTLTEDAIGTIYRASGSISAYVNNSRALFSIQRTFIQDLRIGLGEVANVITNPFLIAGVGISASIIQLILGNNAYNYNEQFTTNSNGDFTLDTNTRRALRTSNYSNMLDTGSNILSDFSNSFIIAGFINSNVITTQFIPQLKSNKVLLGNITTPNSSYQMEMTGDLNLNQLYINSVSLSSLLAQKQDNISTTAPIYLTTGNIGINYDSSLTKVGNNLSVVKTATQPLVWTGNDISLNYDSTLTKVGNNLSVASATASKWTTSGNNIYNNNTANVGIGSLLPQEKLDVNGNAFINGITTIGVSKINPAISTSGGTGGASLILVPNSDPAEYYQEFTLGGGTIVLSEPCSADILCVGAGGNGGTGASSGGGGAGEVIYYPNFPLRAGTLNIAVGASSANINDRISRIYPSSGNEILRARGGGDGGYNTFTVIRQYPSKQYTSIASEIDTTLNGQTCKRKDITLNTTGITYGSGTYELYYITNSTEYLHGPFKLFDYDTTLTGAGGHFGSSFSGGLYGANGTSAYSGTNYLVSSSYKGEWCVIKMPVSILLTSYKFIQRTSFESVSPKDFILYGSLDGTNWTIIETVVGASYTSQIFTSTLSTNANLFTYYGIVVNKLIGGGGSTNVVNFTEWQLFGREITQQNNATSGGSGGGGAAGNLASKTGAVAGTKFDDYKAYALAGLNGSSSTGGNGGSGSSAYNTRFMTTIKGTSLSVGLGGSGVSGAPTPATKTNYGDGGDGNGGVGYGGIVIVRFKSNTNYLQVKAIKNNGNSGLILNANETISGTITPYQLKIYPFQDTYTTTGITTRGYTFQTSDGITNTQLLNLFSYFGGRIGVKTINPSATFEVNGDITCKTFNVIGTEQYGIVCQVVNQHETGEASINVFAGTGVNYGGVSLVYQPSQNLGYISCSKSLKIKTANDAANSYIYINDSTGNIGIGKADPVSKLEINGTTTTNYLSAGIIYAGEVQANIINSLNGNIVNNNNFFSSNIYINNQIDMQNKPIYNCSYLYGGVSWANEWKATTNIYHRDDQGRDRIYFKNDTTGSPPNHFTLFKSGGTTHSFSDKDDVQYCLLERFGLTTYFEVISGGGYDNVGVLDGVSTGTYVFRKMYLRLSTFTEVHRCFIEDELYTNYDDFINEFIGRVVVSKGKIKTALKEADKEWQILEGKNGITIDDSHPIVELSRKKKDKAVVGVITKRNQNSDMPGRLVINSLGETGIWVVNTGNGPLESGDLITTSNELGYGERQTLDDGTADDIIRNFTIGKVMIDCNFELDSPNYKCEVIDVERDLRRAFLPIFIYSG